jgi:putative phosphoesterase
LDALANVDLILHAGDIGSSGIVPKLEKVAPVVAVRGNNDFGSGLKPVEKVVLGDLIIVLAHVPQILTRAMNELTRQGHILGIHGHTHIPKFVQEGSETIVCPGSPTSPRGASQSTVMTLKLSKDAVLSHRFIRV